MIVKLGKTKTMTKTGRKTRTITHKDKNAGERNTWIKTMTKTGRKTGTKTHKDKNAGERNTWRKTKTETHKDKNAGDWVQLLFDSGSSSPRALFFSSIWGQGQRLMACRLR